MFKGRHEDLLFEFEGLPSFSTLEQEPIPFGNGQRARRSISHSICGQLNFVLKLYGMKHYVLKLFAYLQMEFITIHH